MTSIKKHRTLRISLIAIAIVISCMLPCLAESNDSKEVGETNKAPSIQSANELAGELLYSDNFTARKESEWPIHSDSNYTKYYEDGKYHIGVFKSDMSAWEFPKGREFSDFILEVEAAQERGPDDNDYGIVTRFANRGNYSLFLISGDGFYGYFKKENNTVVVPVRWTRSDAIKTGNSTNVLRVVALGDKYTFYINGIEVADYSDSEPVPGNIGLWVEALVDGGAYASFDNLRVWAIKE